MYNNQLLEGINTVYEDLGRLAKIPQSNLSSRLNSTNHKIKGCCLIGFKYKILDCNQNKENPQIQEGQ